MTGKSLSQITTFWTKMEELVAVSGPAALAEYLAVRYFNALAFRIKKYRPQIDDLKAHELASDVFFELIKNEYKGVKAISRDRGTLRGLFFKIVKRKLYREGKKKKHHALQDFDDAQTSELDIWVDIHLDLAEALVKMQKERPRLYQPFVHHYLEGKSIAEIAQILKIKENAVKVRLHRSRIRLSEWLKDHEVNDA